MCLCILLSAASLLVIEKHESSKEVCLLVSERPSLLANPYNIYWCHSVLHPIVEQIIFCILRIRDIEKQARGRRISSGTQPTSEHRTDWYLHYTQRNQWRQLVSPDPATTSPSGFAGLQHSLLWSTWGLCSILPHYNWLVFPSEMSHPALPQNGTSTCNRQAMRKGITYHPQPWIELCSQEKWNGIFKGQSSLIKELAHNSYSSSELTPVFHCW